MKRVKTKMQITLTIDNKIFEIIENKFKNKSKYVNYLIYQDLLKNTNDDEIKKLLL